MKKNSKKLVIGIICAVVGVVGIFGVTSVNDNRLIYILTCLVLVAVGGVLVYLNFKQSRAPAAKPSEPHRGAATAASPSPRFTDNEVANYVNSLVSFKFPETDDKGNRLLKIYELTLSGSKKSFNGVEAQITISNLKIGQQVLLSAQPNNKYDETAVMVTNMNGDYIGWLPVDSSELETMKRRGFLRAFSFLCLFV